MVTVHDLAADPRYENVSAFRLKGGRAIYEDAQYLERGRYESVLVSRLEVGLHFVKRWVDPDTEIDVVALCEVVSPELDARMGLLRN